MDILRQEIIETQRARSELIKWKLLLVSGLGATGFGFAESAGNLNAEVLLCCIPFVCLYVDGQYANLSLRIMGIAAFFREVGARVGVERAMIQYEKLMDVTRRKGRLSLQSFVVWPSSIVFCAFVALYGVATFVLRDPKPSMWLAISMVASGLAGVALDIWLFRQSRRGLEIIADSAKKFAAELDKRGSSQPVGPTADCGRERRAEPAHAPEPVAGPAANRESSPPAR